MSVIGRIRLPSLGALLVSRSLDNLIFRREIGMDNFARLRMGSPIVLAHLGMWFVLALTAGSWFLSYTGIGGLTDWEWVFRVSTSFVITLALTAWPVAYMRAYRSLMRERRFGQLEQIHLTRIPYFEYFEGKFFGIVAPFIESKKYLLLLAWISAGSNFLATRDLWNVVLIAPALLLASDQFALGASLGTTGGLKGATGNRGMFLPMLTNVPMNPWLTHLECIFKSAFWFIFWSCACGFMLMFFLDPLTILKAVVFISAVIAWLGGSSRLADRTAETRKTLMNDFKYIADFAEAP